MKICIITTTENLEAARANAYSKIPQFVGHNILNYPASATGEEPATHWVCQIDANEELRDKLLAAKEYTEIEVMSMKSLLEDRKLKLVKK